MSEVLDVDLLAFEQGDDAQRSAVVDGVMRSSEPASCSRVTTFPTT